MLWRMAISFCLKLALRRDREIISRIKPMASSSMLRRMCEPKTSGVQKSWKLATYASCSQVTRADSSCLYNAYGTRKNASGESCYRDHDMQARRGNS
jgi:hypothetical protein